MGHNLVLYTMLNWMRQWDTSKISNFWQYSNNLRYSNDAIRIQILFWYSNIWIPIFDYRPTHSPILSPNLMIICPSLSFHNHTCTVGQYELESSTCSCYYVDVIRPTSQRSDFLAMCCEVITYFCDFCSLATCDKITRPLRWSDLLLLGWSL